MATDRPLFLGSHMSQTSNTYNMSLYRHKQNTVHLFKQHDIYRCKTSFSCCAGLPGFHNHNPPNCYSKLAQSHFEGGLPITKKAFSLWVKYTGFFLVRFLVNSHSRGLIWRYWGRFNLRTWKTSSGFGNTAAVELQFLQSRWDGRGGGVYEVLMTVWADPTRFYYLMFHWLNICKTDRRRPKRWLIALFYWRRKNNTTKKGHFGVYGGKGQV